MQQQQQQQQQQDSLRSEAERPLLLMIAALINWLPVALLVPYSSFYYLRDAAAPPTKALLILGEGAP